MTTARGGREGGREGLLPVPQGPSWGFVALLSGAEEPDSGSDSDSEHPEDVYNPGEVHDKSIKI